MKTHFFSLHSSLYINKREEKQMNLNLFYAVNKNNILVDVDSVPNGQKCECFCPSCHAPLVAKNGGSVLAHHFAHASGESCVGGYQTSIHMLAKEIIQEKRTIFFPEVTARYRFRIENHEDDEDWEYETEKGIKTLKFGSYYGADYDKQIAKSNFTSTGITSVELEKREGDIIPDIVISFTNGAKLFVEIYVSHKVNRDKKERIKKEGISCIEIDLSKINRMLSKEELTKILYDKKFMDENCYWVYNRKTDILERNYKNFVPQTGQWISFKVKESSRGTGIIWYTTYKCPTNGYRLLDGKQFKTNGCMDCQCCCGTIPADENYYGLPEYIKAFGIYNAIPQISREFNLDLWREIPFKENFPAISTLSNTVKIK